MLRKATTKEETQAWCDAMTAARLEVATSFHEDCIDLGIPLSWHYIEGMSIADLELWMHARCS